MGLRLRFNIVLTFVFLLGLGGIGIWYGLAAGLTFAFVALMIRLLLRLRGREPDGRWVFRPSLGAV